MRRTEAIQTIKMTCMMYQWQQLEGSGVERIIVDINQEKRVRKQPSATSSQYSCILLRRTQPYYVDLVPVLLCMYIELHRNI